MLTFFKNLPRTAISQSFYVDLVTKTKGIGFGYILIVALIGITALAIPLWKPWHDMQAPIQGFFDSLPEISIHEGQLSLPNTATFDAVLPPGLLPHDRVVIDTAYTETNINVLTDKMRQGKIFILAMRDKVATMQSDRDSVSVSSLDTIKEKTITGTQWHRYGHWITAYFYPFFLFFAGLVELIRTLLAVLAAGVPLLIGAKLMDMELDYAGAVRLAAAAKIPAALFAFLLDMPLMVALIAWALWALYGLSTVRKAALRASS